MSDEQTSATPAPSELELLRVEVRAGFAEARAGFAEVRAEIATEGEKSRRHMDVVAKRVESHEVSGGELK